MSSDNNIPLVAFIGLPNSGKSTLLNRICGGRKAITASEAHTTRDLNYGEDFWEGYYLRFVDTGGLVPDPENAIQKQVQVKSWSAVAEADLLVWVIDRRQDPETISQEILSRVWKTGKPFIVAVNKVDDPNAEKDISEYAKLGGVGFVNISATTSYGLNDLMDVIVSEIEKIGFEPSEEMVEEEDEEPKRRKKGKAKLVKKNRDGGFVIVRDQEEDGPGLFRSMEIEDMRVNSVKNIVLDFFGVVFQSDCRELAEDLIKKLELEEEFAEKLKKLLIKDEVGQRLGGVVFDTPAFWNLLFEITGQPESFKEEFLEMAGSCISGIEEVEEFIKAQKEEGKKIYFISNISEIAYKKCKEFPVFQEFEGGVASFKAGMEKPVEDIFHLLIEKYDINPAETVFVDDKEENVVAARESGMWAFTYIHGRSSIFEKLEKVEKGFVSRLPETPKVLLLGRPNVGKSSLFNALCQEDIQIVTEIAGTTLSVNDYLIEQPKRGKKYLLMDTTGIRKPGKRKFGAESFATYRTVQAAHEADVLCIVFDASQTISAQDQLVAGICKEAKKGVVILANKADLLTPETKARFMKDFKHKIKFLKVHQFLWVSAKDWQEVEDKSSNPGNILDIWGAVDTAVQERRKFISREEVRKLFNYLMKKKPPNKLRTKKKPVIYDLLYVKSEPPTFELLVKDRTTVHWSYTRFIENMLRKQFNLYNTGVVLKIKEVEQKKVYG